MKLYYKPGSCSLNVRILVNELQIPCEYEAVDLKTKKTETGQDYLQINLKGTVPVLELDNGEVLTENAVIAQYLADKYHANELLPPISDFKRYRVLEWANYVSTEVHKTMSVMFNPLMPAEIKSSVIVPLIKKKMDFINQHLTGSKFLLGDSLTIADTYLFVTLTWLQHFNLTLSDWPNVARYFTEIKERPAVEKSLQEESK